ncbi:hypothetical protein VP01_2254g6 [Puccinia sorghi]|uniref:Uncharacterized protein n=1 Tax=Puccinia sorghi TaxID=27349 RepID=A0A0L6V8L2_9BASI|nr:hypothetical protein VP01_2254g6 [Puccinia sorghi]
MRMTPQKNTDLIKHYLGILKLRKDEYLILAAYHSYLRDKDDLEKQLLISQCNHKNQQNLTTEKDTSDD